MILKKKPEMPPLWQLQEQIFTSGVSGSSGVSGTSGTVGTAFTMADILFVDELVPAEFFA